MFRDEQPNFAPNRSVRPFYAELAVADSKYAKFFYKKQFDGGENTPITLTNVENTPLFGERAALRFN
jgi:hypothetical protein